MQTRRCLFIPEIFDNICFESTDSPSLAALARTCRSFRDIALDHLWSDIDDIAPLVKCMPPDLFDGELDGIKEFSRPIVENDWIRFREYSRRVKIIDMDCYSQCSSVDVYRLLGEATGVQPLLPNVKEVFWTILDHTYLLYLHVVMGPKVINLGLHIECTRMKLSEGKRLDVIKNLASAYPLLENVQLFYPQNTIQKVVSNVICGWTQLRNLDVDRLSPAALIHIASLPYLHHLSFRGVDTLTPLENFPQARTHPSFPALQHLEIVTTRLSFCTSLIESMRSCALKFIQIKVYDDQLTIAWKRVFLALQNHCKTSSLVNANFAQADFPQVQEGQAEYTATIDTFQPLLSFPNLKYISLPFSHTIITDSAAEAMAMAWPCAKMITLTHGQNRPCLTLQGLVPFAYHCLELVSLDLTLDALSIPSSNSKIENIRIRRGNKNLVLRLQPAGSPMESPEEAAAFLSTLCVSVLLRGIYNGTGFDIDPTSQWPLVASLLKESYTKRRV